VRCHVSPSKAARSMSPGPDFRGTNRERCVRYFTLPRLSKKCKVAKNPVECSRPGYSHVAQVGAKWCAYAAGICRVSTGSQSLEAQLEVLKAAGCQRVYAEKRRGADGEREDLGKLLKAARPDDTVVVCRLDRLARSTRDLLNMLDRLAKAGVGFKSLRETAVDTTTAQGRLVVSILSAISEFERELILSRINEGRK